MADISYQDATDGDYVEEHTQTEVQTAINHTYKKKRILRITLDDGQVINDGSDTETVTIEIVDGLEIARGTDPTNATVLGYDGDATVTVDGAETTKTLASGVVSFDVTTTKDDGSVIEIIAEGIADHPAESDRAVIEVTA